ncbi:hypothetical protein HHI36_001718 [Cryptolaemus montrouzieri]|uniref:DNA mismatch repair protein S5 domain-containing protein n=1 Tax=Cryptolaemus montrouzieri TaxID=559131 RepID=A0ABD2P8A3_9CUCU
MEIKSLSKDIISRLRSSYNVKNFTHCVTELVLNSLDAKSSAIAIRVNSVSFRIQVVDNGVGISQTNMERVGHKYRTSKCNNLQDFERKVKTYGYRGESLWSISNISKLVNITSKLSNSDKTFSKNIFKGIHGQVASAKIRRSNGTTVTIDGLLHNLPVRQKRMKPEFELEEVTTFLKSISIIHPQVSISLREDSNGNLLFKSLKYNNVIQSFISLHPDIKEEDLTVMKVRKERIAVEALLPKQTSKNKIAYIFVNKRPVDFPKLQNFVSQKLLMKITDKSSTKNNLHPIFLINIKCSLSSFELLYKCSKPTVEFRNSDLIYGCLDKLFSNFMFKSEKVVENNSKNEKRKSGCGVSELIGAVKGYGFKNWIRNDSKKTSEEIESFSILDNKSEKSKIHVVVRHSKSNERTLKKVNLDKPKPLPIEVLDRKKLRPEKKGLKDVDQKMNCSTKTKERDVSPTKSLVPANSIEINRAILDNYKNLEEKFQEFKLKQELNKTMFSNFTSSEDKGKNLIMLMFLKSTELFPENISQEKSQQPSEKSFNTSSKESNETIMQSNLFCKNVLKTKTHQLNKTISVSVKLKRKRNSKSPIEKSNILSNFTFNTLEPKRRKKKN